MKLILLFLVAAVSLGQAEETWRSRVKPEQAGDFPPVKPFRAEFRFGWSNVVSAASAYARMYYKGDKIVTEVTGGTRGLARTLWSLDARHRAETKLSDFMPVSFSQSEVYAKKKVNTEAVAKPDGLWYIRRVVSDPANKPKWKRVKVEPVRDIVSGMLFMRSLPLKDGDRIGLIAFPGDSPFLCEVLVEKRETVKVGGKPVKAIKMSFQLQRIDMSHDNQLVTHGKFRSGAVWVSDDENRIPLRAEVQIFVGYVYGELVSINYLPQQPPAR
jgi:hypothetical protein